MFATSVGFLYAEWVVGGSCFGGASSSLSGSKVFSGLARSGRGASTLEIVNSAEWFPCLLPEVIFTLVDVAEV